MLRIELDELTYEAGAHVTGQVWVEADHERVRGVTVELAHRDSSRRNKTTGFTVAAKRELHAPGAEPAKFTLAIPGSALPGFTGRYGKVEWLIRASADVTGIDPTTTASFEVAAPSEPTLATAQPNIPSNLQARAERPSRPKGQAFDTLMLVGLLGFGFVLLFMAFDDYVNEDAGNGALGFGMVAVGFIAFMAWMLLQRHPLKLRNVTVEPLSTVVSRGNPVQASVTVNRSGLAIGLEGVERYAEDRKGEHGRNVVYPEHVFHAEWLPIESGVTEAVFDVPADGLVSYDGTALIIDWRLVVVREKHRKRTVRLSQHATRVLVVH